LVKTAIISPKPAGKFGRCEKIFRHLFAGRSGSGFMALQPDGVPVAERSMKPHDKNPCDDRTFSVVFLPGDGVGPEVAGAARRVLETAADMFGYDFKFSDALIGGAAIDSTGDPLPRATVEACLRADAVFLGAVGGPRWGGERRPEEGLLGLRKAMGLYANLRPVAVPASLVERSPFKADIVRGVDLLMVRELTGGAYFGEKTRSKDVATDLCIYTVAEIERVARAAFKAAQARNGHVISVDKANVLETSRLWREVVGRIGREEFPDVELEHMLVDSAAMRLIETPRAFDVILTENMFGDILSDEAAMLTGSIGLLGSASLGEAGPGLYEPIHGPLPDIAGMDKANPVGAIVSAAMLVRHSLHVPALADQIQHAVTQALHTGRGTADIGGQDSTSAFTAAVVEQLGKSRWSSAHRPQMHWA
jgi:3-isopropylmalate dehydrogenase